jgi:hypothetical protein
MKKGIDKDDIYLLLFVIGAQILSMWAIYEILMVVY